MIVRNLRKIMQQLLLMFSVLKKTKSRKKNILLMIPNGEGWHYIAVKQLPELLRGIMSKHYDDFEYLNCLNSFVTEIKREIHKEYVKVKIFLTL